MVVEMRVMHQRKTEDAGVKKKAAALGFGIRHACRDEQLACTFQAIKIDRFDDGRCLGSWRAQSRTANSIDTPLRLRLVP